ncbi:MAG: aspartyl protease family protein [Pseudomonadota bacterium]
MFFSLLASCSTTDEGLLSDISILPISGATAILSYRESRTAIPVVELEVEGRGKFRFIVDTGANTSAIYPSSAERIGLSRRPDTERIIVRGLTGIEDRPAATLSNLMIGSDRFNSLKVAILSERRTPPDVDGILGTDVLSNYVLFFEPDQDQLYFLSPQDYDRLLYSDWHRVPISPLQGEMSTRGLWFATTEIVSRPVPVLIDTGADFSVLNWHAARRKADLNYVYQSLLRDWEVAGATGTFRPSVAIIFDRIEMGEHAWGGPRFLIFGLDALEGMIGADQPLMIAGANLFANRRFVVDFERSEILIDPYGPHLRDEQAILEETTRPRNIINIGPTRGRIED